MQNAGRDLQAGTCMPCEQLWSSGMGGATCTAGAGGRLAVPMGGKAVIEAWAHNPRPHEHTGSQSYCRSSHIAGRPLSDYVCPQGSCPPPAPRPQPPPTWRPAWEPQPQPHRRACPQRGPA